MKIRNDETDHQLYERIVEEVNNEEFNYFQICGLKSDPYYALRIGALIGYMLALKDFEKIHDSCKKD